MARNQKLAPLLAGRVIATVEPPAAQPAAPVSRFAPSAGATWTVRFADGSALTVRTDGSPPDGAERAGGAAVSDVTQRGTTLTLALAAGASPNAPPSAAGAALAGALVFHTAEASGCVMLRDAKGAMEYAD